MERRTKIVAALGPGTSKEETSRDLVRFGMDVTRLNFSHSDHETHIKTVVWIAKKAVG